MTVVKSLGEKNPKAVLNYLREIGDEAAVEELTPSGAAGQGLERLWGRQVWGYTGMLCGYLAPEASGPISKIENAIGLEPDCELKNSRVKITLEKFWVHRYPGSGKHQILCEFTGKNQIQNEPEELRFALTTEVRDEASAAISGSPIFLGVSVGENGISFEGRTINVKSETDDTILQAIASGPFKEGLGLLTKAQPALKPFVGLTNSVVQSVLSRSKNVQVFHFKLGLDFSNSMTSVPLRLGSYIVVQGDAANWDWGSVSWSSDSGQIVDNIGKKSIPYNYIVFRVSEYTEK